MQLDMIGLWGNPFPRRSEWPGDDDEPNDLENKRARTFNDSVRLSVCPCVSVMYTCDFSRGIGNSLDLVHHGGASEVIIAKPQLHRRHDHFLRSVAIFFRTGAVSF